MKKKILSMMLAVCMALSLLPTVALAEDGFANETTANGQYHLSYFKGDDAIKPTVSGTDNSPVLTFERTNHKMSGGVITSNYTMDFTRSFNIEGHVSTAERDGVSFALHTTKDKASFKGGHNTGMLGENMLQKWDKAQPSFTVTEMQNNITNGLLWDFMTYDSNTNYTDKRFHKGAYSYQIVNTSTVKALQADNGATNGMISYSSKTVDGAFKLSWQCSDAQTATGKLTLQMGNEITFTYSNLNASEIFGNLAKAKAVYFSFSTFMPKMGPGGGGDVNESITKTQIAIDKAYYTDTGDENGSTLGVETAYYIDTDVDGTYETQLKKATLVGPNQTVLCRNKIYNRNKNAISEMDMTMLIPNLSCTTSGTEPQISSIDNQKFYLHPNGAPGETNNNSKMSPQGNGPLNSIKPLTDYVKVTLPAGGDGTTAYEDAYAVYEYTFTPGANATALNQTIQLGVAPFTPAILSSTVFFNSPEAFRPDNTAGKILFGTDGAGGNGLYRVVAKDKTSITLFYNGADISASGMAQSAASTWLNGELWNMLTAQEQAALLPYGVDSITEKVVLPSETEVGTSGTWNFDDADRATAESGEAGTDWWLRTPGNSSTARAVTQNGTQIVDISTTEIKGVRPVMKLNLANVLFTKDKEVNLTNSPSKNLSPLSVVGGEQAPFRMTLLDAKRNFAVTEDNAQIDVSVGDEITFHYSGATVGENCYISALLTNSAGQDIYYGRLKAISTATDADGTATVTVPSGGLSNGTYTLKLFSESIYADKASDVASSLQSMTLTLGNNLNGTVRVTGTAEYGCTLTAAVTNSNYKGTLRYQWKRDGSAITVAKDRSYTLTAEDIGKSVTCEVTDSGDGKRDNSIASAAATIEKRTLVVKADDKRITRGSELPPFTVTMSGFVYGNTVTDLFDAPPTAAVDVAVDGKTSGTFHITVTAELSTDAGTLYVLSKQAGILTVSSPSSGGPTTKPTEPVTGRTESKATVDDQGNATVSLTDKNITDVIANAKAEADEKGVNAGEITAVINVTTGGKDAGSITINLPKSTQEQVLGNKVAKVVLVIDRPDIIIGMDLKAVDEINRQAQADVQLSATRTDMSRLSAEAQSAIGKRPVFDLSMNYGSGKSISEFGAGTVRVEIPYKLQHGEQAAQICGVYVDTAGKVSYLQDFAYNTKSQSVDIHAKHFSVYGVGYKANAEKFSDIANHWAKASIEFVAARGLMTGTGNGKFSPDAPMTRGMFVTALGRLAKADVSGYKQSSFSDVKADTYYMSYIEWAAKYHIVLGIGEGKFAPDSLVTREQMAAIMERYVSAMGIKLAEVHAANTFADSSKIGAWAATSVKRIQMAGILQGKSGNLFDPQGSATRAEVATVLHRFVEMTIPQ